MKPVGRAEEAAEFVASLAAPHLGAVLSAFRSAHEGTHAQRRLDPAENSRPEPED